MRLRDRLRHAVSDEMVASDRRSWAGSRKRLTHLQSVTLDPGILHPWGGLFTCTLVCVSTRDRMVLVLSFLFLLRTTTQAHKSVCIWYLLYYFSITDTRRWNWAKHILVSNLYYLLQIIWDVYIFWGVFSSSSSFTVGTMEDHCPVSSQLKNSAFTRFWFADRILDCQQISVLFLRCSRPFHRHTDRSWFRHQGAGGEWVGNSAGIRH